MKANYFIRFILMLLIIPAVSCSSDDDGNQKKVESIVGKWAIEASIINDVQKEYEHQIGCEKDYYEFTVDNLFTIVGHEENCYVPNSGIYVDYIVNDNKLLVYSEEDDEIYIDATFSIEGNILEIIFDTEDGDIIGIFKKM
ncbi:hypothetical protein [Aureivirga sp. CE67]|uniref:hypothetical protein n=1 Tax=Aureivirga sp. CE67 TaxID=1788983 RepID=UPI0018C9268A|nr:hypothetical protein [Aureivirga sp. CE67]